MQFLNLRMSVFEIKGAPCTRRAHFWRRAHIFLRCAAVFFSMIYYYYIFRESMDKLPTAQNTTLISNTVCYRDIPRPAGCEISPLISEMAH